MGVCESCNICKAHFSLHPTRNTIYTTLLELVYANLWEPSPVVLSQGFKYFLNFVNTMSKYNWVFLLTSKA